MKSPEYSEEWAGYLDLRERRHPELPMLDYQEFLEKLVFDANEASACFAEALKEVGDTLAKALGYEHNERPSAEALAELCAKKLQAYAVHLEAARAQLAKWNPGCGQEESPWPGCPPLPVWKGPGTCSALGSVAYP